MNKWSVNVILEFDDKYSDSIEIIMAGFDKTQWDNTYILKSKNEHYSTFSTNRAISRVKQALAKKGIPCSVYVGRPKLN